MDTIYDALRACVDALGGPKEAGKRLRPEKTLDDARQWILCCLNAERSEKFDPEQVMWLLREARQMGYHDAAYFVADDTGYSHPLPITREAETEKLQREFIDAVNRQERLMAQMQAAHINVGAME